MAETKDPLLIKRYASRRLYNTETSDYVTLEDIASFISEGREVRLDSLGWARYGFGPDWAVRAKLREVSSLNPLKRSLGRL